MPLPLGKGRPQGRPASPRLTQPVGLSPETSSHPPHSTEGAALPGQSCGSWVLVPRGLLTQLLTLPSNPCHRLLPARRPLCLSHPPGAPRSAWFPPCRSPSAYSMLCLSQDRALVLCGRRGQDEDTDITSGTKRKGHQSTLASRHLVCSRTIFISLLFTFWPCLSARGIFVP